MVLSSIPGVQAKNEPAVSVMESPPMVRWTTIPGLAGREDDLASVIGSILADE